jgi:protein TonB
VEPVPEPLPEAALEAAASPAVVSDATPETLGVEPGSGGPGSVIAGVVGGVLGGREGGLVGASEGTALELAQVARPPAVLEQVAPRYPRQARSRGIQGLVLVRIILGVDGRVEPGHTRVLRSVPALDAAALSAVSQWRFSPALGHHGRPVRVILEVPIQFTLK